MGTDPSTPPGADPPTDPPDPDPPGDETDPGDSDAGKTDAGRLREMKAALAAERRARHAAEKDLAKIRDETASDADRAIAAARDEGRRDALGQVSARLVEAEVRAAAGGRLADPADAVRLLDVASFVDGETGDIDGAAIRSALDDLIESKPYLRASTGDAKANGAGRTPAPQGTRPGPTSGDDGDAFLRSVVRGS
jgi:hypothetical protein